MAGAVLGIDTGGTFTDFVFLADDVFRVYKVPSNPAAPQDAIMQGILEMGLVERVRSGDLLIVHGTTVATNAALEGKGVRTAYVTNAGLKDVLLIGRQVRPRLYDLTPPEVPTAFDRDLMFEVNCRITPDGERLAALTEEDLERLAREIERAGPASVAVNLLFSFVSGEDEARIAQRLSGEYFVCISSSILPEYREYERGVTTWVNAWLGPIIHRYLTALAGSLAPSRLAVMQSSGLTIGADGAAERAVNLLLSGPAGGLSATRHLAPGDRLMTFDMGGTSTDVALLDGAIKLTNQGRVAGFPIGVPMADIHTIGAGGGSIAYVDEGGLLQVGPASAGADPGPACYGKGGAEPTVTDANLVLGRLLPDAFLGGRMPLDQSAAMEAIRPLADRLGLSIEEVALGIVRVANEHMTQALRVISVQRGHDPREFALTCFGGAGGLHFCDLAEALSMHRAVVPVHGGVFSALGMIVTPPGRELVRTHRTILDGDEAPPLESLFQELEDTGNAELAAQGASRTRSTRSVDVRYAGQTFTINLPAEPGETIASRFHAAHESRYGYALPAPVELINARVHLEGDLAVPALPDALPGTDPQTGTTRIAGIGDAVPVISRSRAGKGYHTQGPCLVIEDHATTLVKPGWELTVDRVGNLVLTREAVT
ncbi:MAG: hydantoinase/oxoprolinase family protein [Pseudomonadales bacterium]|nr:hydantoinase/oxoprolinase family protein [Pseudomonadales bacterium]